MFEQAKNIIVPNPAKLKKLVAAFKRGGADKIHVLADFDKTLIKAYVNGKYINSLLAILRDERYLTEDYAKKSYALYNKYHPLEENLRLSRAAKKRSMEKWWVSQFKLLIKSGLNKKNIFRAIKSDRLRLRAGARRFFKLLESRGVPLIIMSATGLGEESIRAYLHQARSHIGRIHIISNKLLWGKNGRMIGFKRPIITSANKDETVIKNFPEIFKIIKVRTNVLLLGDQLEDLRMITGFKCNHLIKIGFYNHKNRKNLAPYKKNFDIIILNDSSLGYVNQLLKTIISS